MPGKVLIIRWGGSDYDSLGGLLELTAGELAGLGFQSDIFAIERGLEQLPAVLSQGGYSFALTMSGIASDVYLSDGRLLWEAVRVPLFNWNCDHPAHYPSRHVIRNPYLTHGYVFPDHARYNIRHLNPNGIAYGVHIGMPPRSAFPNAPLPFGARNGRIVFSKSGQDTNAIEARWRTSSLAYQGILFEAAEALMAQHTAAFVPIIRQAGERRGILLDGSSKLMLALITELDKYLRARIGNLTVRALMSHAVDIYGAGWEHLPWDGAAARYHGPLGWRQMLATLPNYTGAVSLNPLIEDSVHDRVFFAIAAGVVPLSDSNAFSRQHAPALEPYAFACSSQGIEAAIDALLCNPADAIDRTEATWRTMADTFTMRHAARQIVEYAQMGAVNARWGA